ncbi:MAG: hypothetical protein WD228_00545 [Mycobacterium sp.]
MTLVSEFRLLVTQSRPRPGFHFPKSYESGAALMVTAAAASVAARATFDPGLVLTGFRHDRH